MADLKEIHARWKDEHHSLSVQGIDPAGVPFTVTRPEYDAIRSTRATIQRLRFRISAREGIWYFGGRRIVIDDLPS